MQSTSINLLTRDGALSATFTPALTSSQYDQLLHEVENDGDTFDELKEVLQKLAGQWKCKVAVD
jgi:hypothetical protein